MTGRDHPAELFPSNHLKEQAEAECFGSGVDSFHAGLHFEGVIK